MPILLIEDDREAVLFPTIFDRPEVAKLRGHRGRDPR